MAQIPNSSFENWKTTTQDTTIEGGWEGSKLDILEKIYIYTQQGTNSRMAEDGKYFLRLKHTDSSNGKIALGYLKNKFAFSSRPKSFVFSGMYFPQLQGEGFAVIITLTDGEDTISNTIGTFGSTTILDWTPLAINLNYNSATGQTPDSCYIRFQLLPTSSNTVNLNTTLLIDELHFNNYSVSVEELMENYNRPFNVKAYPNPANTNTTIAFTLKAPEEVKLNLYDLTGKMVLSETINALEGNNTFDFDVTNLPTGFYLYKITTGSQTVSGKLSVIH